MKFLTFTDINDAKVGINVSDIRYFRMHGDSMAFLWIARGPEVVADDPTLVIKAKSYNWLEARINGK